MRDLLPHALWKSERTISALGFLQSLHVLGKLLIPLRVQVPSFGSIQVQLHLQYAGLLHLFLVTLP